MPAQSVPVLIDRHRFEKQCGNGTVIARVEKEQELQVCFRHQSQNNRIIDWAAAEIDTPNYPVRYLCHNCAVDLGVIKQCEIRVFSEQRKGLRRIIIEYAQQNGFVDVDEIELLSGKGRKVVVISISQLIQLGLIEPDTEVLGLKKRGRKLA